jgi:MFS family permease
MRDSDDAHNSRPGGFHAAHPGGSDAVAESPSAGRNGPVTDNEGLAKLVERWRVASVFVIIGSACVVAGGLVGAVTGPTDFEHGSWLAAYLVLVGGVAQIVLGVAQAWLAQQVPPARSTRREAWAWNIGVAAVVLGTLVSEPVLTTVGGTVLMLALVLFVVGVRRVRPSARRVGLLYRGVVGMILVSIPIGVVLSWTRHG